MDIVQVDSKTIKIKKSGFTFQLHYHYLWDKVLRSPESVVLDGNKVNVFFPTSVQKDLITEHDRGFSVKRYWQIIPAGEIALFFTLDLLDYFAIPYHFPGLLSGDAVPHENIIFMGERLSYPSSVFLFPGNKSIMVSGSVPEKQEDQGSISVGIVPVNPGKRLRTEIIFPKKEKLPRVLKKKNGFLEGLEENYYVSTGNLIKEFTFYVLIEPQKEIYSLAVKHAHEKWRTIFKDQPSFSRGEALDMIKKGIEKTIASLFVNARGIAGPKVSIDKPVISATTAAGFSCLLQRFFETDLSMHEMSLKSADFALKAQHPRGLFFEYYSPAAKEWELPGDNHQKINGSSGKNSQTPVLSVLYSARIINYLLILASILEKKGYHSQKYFIAADKCINLFFDQKNKLIEFGSDFNMETMTPEKQSLLCFEIIQPLIKLYGQTQKEKYKKAIKKIKDDFLFDDLPPHILPAAEGGEKPDFATSLMLLKTVVTLIDAGFTVKNIDLYIHCILPWIYFNTSSSPIPFHQAISMIDSFSRNRLIFRGFECAYYFLRMVGITEEKKYQELLQDLAKEIILSSKNVPMGTPWYQHTLWNPNGNEKTAQGIVGEFSSEVFVREALYLLNITEDFPWMFQ